QAAEAGVHRSEVNFAVDGDPVVLAVGSGDEAVEACRHRVSKLSHLPPRRGSSRVIATRRGTARQRRCVSWVTTNPPRLPTTIEPSQSKPVASTASAGAP